MLLWFWNFSIGFNWMKSYTSSRLDSMIDSIAFSTWKSWLGLTVFQPSLTVLINCGTSFLSKCSSSKVSGRLKDSLPMPGYCFSSILTFWLKSFMLSLQFTIFFKYQEGEFSFLNANCSFDERWSWESTWLQGLPKISNDKELKTRFMRC